MKEEEKNKIKKEFEVSNGLTHPNLLRFIEMIETEDNIYIIMELASKGDLSDNYNMFETPESIKKLFK